MSEVETKAKPASEHADHEPAWLPDPLARVTPKRKRRLVPVLVTVLVAAVAALLGWSMWNAYMGTPWTRDGTVRAYVVTMAPEVAGHIVALPVVDNEYVHKGDLLMVIDPINYQIAVSQAEATVQQAEASVQNIDAQIAVQQAQISVNQAQVDRAQAALVFAKQQAGRYGRLAQDGWGTVQDAQQYGSQLRQQDAAVVTALENLTLVQRQIASLKAQHMSAEASVGQAKAQLRQADVNLRRTRILSPVDGYVTNLLAQLGDYVNVGVNTISVVDASSFWVDGVFRGDQHRAHPRWRSGRYQADGLQPGTPWTCQQHRPRDQRHERTAERAGDCHGQPDLHLGAARAKNSRAYPYRPDTEGARSSGRDDCHGPNR